ncbi:MAG TPA: hypothetical protein VH328_12665 [Burkholderiaceae bacterium]|jgi:hypothetical protein|nr:hypothetical protein [Burkholderiaceae bacterium]
MNEIETDVVNRPVFLESADKPAPRKTDRKALLVFFSFVAALALLVALNMK